MCVFLFADRGLVEPPYREQKKLANSLYCVSSGIALNRAMYSWEIRGFVAIMMCASFKG